MTKTDSTKDADGDLTMAIPSLGLQHSGTSTQDEFDNHSDDESDYRGHALALQQQQQDSQYANEEEEEEEFNPFLFIKSLPPYQYAIPPNWSSRTKALPPLSRSSPPICLVLDLDETLVHCTVEPIQNADMVFPVEFNGMEYVVHVRCRPFLKEFLEKVSAEFEVVVFTASQQVYADKLLDKIDPGEFVVFRTLFC
jgi:TFIIF-interacting CTD phosphatase-like protein